MPKRLCLLVACCVLLASTQASAQSTPWETSTAAGLEAYQQGRYGEAEKYLSAALKEAENFGPEDPRLATSLNNLAGIYVTQGKYAEAEPLYKRSLAILGPEHPDVAASLNNLAVLYDNQGRYEEAEPLYQRALAVYEEALGPEHPNTSHGLNNLAALYYSQRRYKEAEPRLNNLALLYYHQGHYEEAEPLYERALAILEKVLGPEHPHTAGSLTKYARLLRALGREDEAARLEARVQR